MIIAFIIVCVNVILLFITGQLSLSRKKWSFIFECFELWRDAISKPPQASLFTFLVIQTRYWFYDFMNQEICQRSKKQSLIEKNKETLLFFKWNWCHKVVIVHRHSSKQRTLIDVCNFRKWIVILLIIRKNPTGSRVEDLDLTKRKSNKRK